MFPNNIKLSTKEHYTVCVYNTLVQAIGSATRFKKAGISCNLLHGEQAVSMRSEDFLLLEINSDSKKRLNTIYSYAK